MHKALRQHQHGLSKSLVLSLLLTLVAAVTAISPARADMINYSVRVDTSPLINRSAFRFDFFFNNGTTPLNSTATLSNFNFGGGTGTAATPVTFQDVDPIPDSNGNPVTAPQSSGTLTSPGNFLSYNLSFNYTIDTPLPDSFSFALFDTTVNDYVMSSNAPDGISLYNIDFNSSTPSVQTYSDTNYGVLTSTVTPLSTVATPEPATWAMMAIGICSVGLLGRKRRKSQVTV